MGDIIPLKDFERATKENLTFTLFYSPWNSESRALEKSFKEVASLFDGKEGVRFFSIDVNVNPKYSVVYDVQALPLVSVFRQGIEVKRLQGVITKRYLKDEIGAMVGTV